MAGNESLADLYKSGRAEGEERAKAKALIVPPSQWSKECK
jgi:hypothetical protein